MINKETGSRTTISPDIPEGSPKGPAPTGGSSVKKPSITKETKPNGITNYTTYDGGPKEVHVDTSVRLSMELLISLDEYGFKYSNLKIISDRSGSDRLALSKEIIEDLKRLKDSFIDNYKEILD